MNWLNAVIQGVFLGGFYALFACGLSLMFGVMRIINLAHGDLAITGAFAVWLVATHLHLSPFIALLPVLPGMLLLGYVLHRILLARSLRSGPLTPLLTTFGLSIVIQNALLQIFSPDVHSLGSFASPVSTGSWRINSQLSVPYFGLLVLAVAILLLGALQFVLQRTGFGWENASNRSGCRYRGACWDPGLIGLRASHGDRGRDCGSGRSVPGDSLDL